MCVHAVRISHPAPSGWGGRPTRPGIPHETEEVPPPPLRASPEPRGAPPQLSATLFPRRAVATARAALSSAWHGLAHWWQPPQGQPTGERPHRSTGWGPPPPTSEQGRTALHAGRRGGDNNGTVARAAVRSGSLRRTSSNSDAQAGTANAHCGDPESPIKPRFSGTEGVEESKYSKVGSQTQVSHPVHNSSRHACAVFSAPGGGVEILPGKNPTEIMRRLATASSPDAAVASSSSSFLTEQLPRATAPS